MPFLQDWLLSDSRRCHQELWCIFSLTRLSLASAYLPADVLRNRMMSARSSAFGTWKLISLSGTRESVLVSHLSRETSSQVTRADFKASEYLKVEMLPAVRP